MISKKYIAVLAVMMCLGLQAVAQPVIVEQTARTAKSYYTPEMGLTIDVGMGYTKGLGDASSYADATPLPSYNIGVGYVFDEHWRIGLSYQKSYLQQDMGPKSFVFEGNQGVSGHAVRNMDFDNILLGGDYSFPVSRWVRPYVGVSIGMGSVKMDTKVSNTYSFQDSKWMFAVSPEAGIRGFFDKGLTVGYRANVSYNQYFGTLETVDAKVSSPSYLRIAAGVFVKFL